MQFTKLFIAITLSSCFVSGLRAQHKPQNFNSHFSRDLPEAVSSSESVVIHGAIVNQKGLPVVGANVVIKALSLGTTTDFQGNFKLLGKGVGTYLLEVSYLGYQPYKRAISIGKKKRIDLDIVLKPSRENLESVVISTKSKLKQIEAMAFNVEVLDVEKLANTSLSAGEALRRVSGIRVRQSGGVGADLSVSLNGFTGKQVKVFIDGVPMDNFGSSFNLSNLPVDLIKRIEVYKGVVPIHLGADALGGAINIVTKKRGESHLRLSYSYGSFNTHHSTINAAYVAESGFTAKLRAYQNYSDNDYWMRDIRVADLQTGEYYPDNDVRRFHDTYHNETLIAEVGVLNTSWADKFLLGITLGQNYDEVQTGARVETVYGAWHTEGTLIMPTLKYVKHDFLTEGLSVDLTANFNLGEEQIIDTINRRYNWLGDYVDYNKPGGERNYSMYKFKNNTGVATVNLAYQINDQHAISLSDVASTFNREGGDQLEPNNAVYSHPKKTFKNVLGLGYRYKNDRWSASAFLKQYNQTNKFAQPYNPTGDYGDVAYHIREQQLSQLGYGLTAAYYVTDNLQVKASYEKSYRLPSANELFGNLVTLEGNIDLDPEKSHNYNLGVSYAHSWKIRHYFDVSINGFYRDASDFIRPVLNSTQAMQVMDNLFSVTNLGVSAELSYSYGDAFSIGANMTYQNLRNNTKYVADQNIESIVYRDRIPNMPYLFGGLHAAYTFDSPLNKKDHIQLSYNMLYVHSFFLYWPSLGDDKFDIPTQTSHNINLTYTLGEEDNLKLTLSCRNLTDNLLYDNFSLQKPGRSFSAKISYAF